MLVLWLLEMHTKCEMRAWMLHMQRCWRGWWRWSKWWLLHISNVAAGSKRSTVSEYVRWWQFGINHDWRKHL